MSKHVTIQRVKDNSLAAKGNSGHWVVMDSPAEYGGNGGGASPMEMVLMGLGGCTSMDVLSILKKMKEKITDYNVEISAENAEEHPKVYTNIDILYRFYGKGLKERNIIKAMELSQEKYCSVSAMLKKSVSINYRFEIIEENS